MCSREIVTQFDNINNGLNVIVFLVCNIEGTYYYNMSRNFVSTIEMIQIKLPCGIIFSVIKCAID